VDTAIPLDEVQKEDLCWYICELTKTGGGRILELGEELPTSGPVSLGGYLKFKAPTRNNRNRTNKQPGSQAANDRTDDEHLYLQTAERLMRKQHGQAIAFSPVRVGESGKSRTIQVPSASRSRLAYDFRQQSDHVVDKYQSPGSSEISNISILDAFEMGGAFRYVDQHDTGDLSVYQYSPSATTGYDLIGLISHNRLPIFRTSIRVSKYHTRNNLNPSGW